MVAPMSRFPPTSVTGRPPPLSCHASSSPSCHATSQPPNLGSDPSLSLPWRALARSDSLSRCTAVDVAARLSLRQSPPHASPSDASQSPSPALSPARPGSHARPSRRDGSSREPRCITIALPPSAAHGSSSITTPGRRGRRGVVRHLRRSRPRRSRTAAARSAAECVVEGVAQASSAACRISALPSCAPPRSAPNSPPHRSRQSSAAMRQPRAGGWLGRRQPTARASPGAAVATRPRVAPPTPGRPSTDRIRRLQRHVGSQ